MSQKSSSNSAGNQRQAPVHAKDLLVLHRPANKISKCWQISQMLSFFICSISGLAVCISLGKIHTAFGGECILYGTVSISRLPVISSHIRSRHINISDTTWGQDSDCNYCQYFPMAGACAAIIMGVLFLEFGSTDRSWLLRFTRSGTNRSHDSTWKMVVPGIIVSSVFFILACIALANTVGGLLYFCEHVLHNSNKELNLTSCIDVYHLSWEINRLPNDVENVDVYANVLLTEIGASLHFVGWFLALFILIARCGSSVDFVTVKKSKFRSSVDSIDTIPVFTEDDSEISEEEAPLFVPQRKSDGIGKNTSLWVEENSSTA